MEITFRSAKPEHLKLINPTEFQQEDLQLLLTPEYAHMMKEGTSVSMWVGVRCFAVAGIIPVYPMRKALAWSLVSKDAGPYMLRLTKALKKYLNDDPIPRIEMFVNSEFKQGHQWAKMLGFVCETPEGMKKHSPVGEDEHLYARVK